jgi:hypothetical protein
MIDVSELKTEPEIGRFYLVPTVRNIFTEAKYPVLGDLHEDREYIGFPERHWHVDSRFVPKQLLIDGPRFGIATILSRALTTPAFEFISVKRWKCKRQTPMHPYRFDDLWNAFQNHHLKSSMICPHKGVDLSSQPVIDGCVTCPLHGLTWSVATGKLTDRKFTGSP